VSPLAEVQALFRQAVVTGEKSRLVPLLSGGRYPAKRLAIHQRHYETSLVTALLGKFPATTWLTGTRFVTEAATRFVHDRVPQAPCIAEYGREFPMFLSSCRGAVRVPYLYDFAELEWQVGQLAIAVDEPPIGLAQLSTIAADALPETILALQPGISYLQVPWPVDELMKLYLNDRAPEHFSMEPLDVWLELRGARGEFHINRLNRAEYLFRTSILARRSIGDAAERALDVDAAFEPGHAWAALINERLVTSITR